MRRGLWALMLWVGACAAPGAQVSARSGAEERLLAVAEAHKEEKYFEVRINKAPCDVPDAEVLIDGVWYRVFLEPDNPEGPADRLRKMLEKGPEGGGVKAGSAKVFGKLLSRVRVAGNRSPYLVLVVQGICAEGLCSDLEGGD